MCGRFKNLCFIYDIILKISSDFLGKRYNFETIFCVSMKLNDWRT